MANEIVLQTTEEGGSPKEVPLRFYDKRWTTILGAFIGGPLVVGYFLSKNYRALHQKEYARKALWLSFGCTVSLIFIFFTVTQSLEFVRPWLFYLFLALLSLFAVFWYVLTDQEALREKEVEKSAVPYSAWNAIGLGIFFLVVAFSTLIFLLLLFEPTPRWGGEYPI